MKNKLISKVLAAVVVLGLLFSQAGLAHRLLRTTGPPAKLEGDFVLSNALAIPGDLLDVTGDGLAVEPVSQPLGPLTSADWQLAYEQAKRWLYIGEYFRGREIQRLDYEQCLMDDDNPEFCSFSVVSVENNYIDFTEYSQYWRFCADYDEPYVSTHWTDHDVDDPGDQLKLDAFGYCPEWDDLDSTQKGLRVDGGELTGQQDIRNKLIDARRLFAVLAVYPSANLELDEVRVNSDGTVEPTGTQIRARDLGQEGLLDATREMVNVHMVFGNEFMVKALRYPFSITDTSSETIVEQELKELERALRQYELAADSIVLALNLNLGGVTDTYIGDFFTEQEFAAFAAASKQMVLALNEIARRERVLGVSGDESALVRLADGFIAQHLQALALADQATRLVSDDPDTDLDESRVHFLDNGGWDILDNLQRLVQQSQSIRAGLNPLGYEDTYVPLQSFEALHAAACGDGAGDQPTVACLDNAGLLGSALASQAALIASQRDFDQSFADLKAAVSNMHTEYDTLLTDLCGESVGTGPDGLKDYGDCEFEGGLMLQNALDMYAADRAVDLAWNRVVGITETIKSEQERATEVISITINAGGKLAAQEYAIGKLEAIRRSSVYAISGGQEFYAGVEAYFDSKTTAKVKGSLNPVGCILGGCTAETEASLEAGIRGAAGFKLSLAFVETAQWVTDWNAEAIRGHTGWKEVLAHERDCRIEHANSEARIRELLREQTYLLIEYELAEQDLKKATVEHNQLVAQRQLLLNQRAGTVEAIQESYLAKPYFRLMRDTAALKAAEDLDEVIQAAYLTAKALEYLTLTPVSNIYELYRARNADNVRDFLDRLASEFTPIQPENYSKTTYRISVAQDILGWTDEYLSATYDLTDPQDIKEKRFELFQEFVQDSHIVNGDTNVDKIAFTFDTTLEDPVFRHGVANNRIARTSDTDPGCTAGDGCRGLWVNIFTRQDPTDFEGRWVEVKLTHGGHGSYRNGSLEIVEYDPGPTKIIGHTPPPGFDDEGSRTTNLDAHINLGYEAQPDPNRMEDQFHFLSVATPGWILEINLRNPIANTDLDIEQIEDIELRMDTTFFSPTGSRRFQEYLAMDKRRVEARAAGRPVPEDVMQFLEAYEREQAALRQAQMSAAPVADQEVTADAAADDYLGLAFVVDPVNLGTWDIGFTLAFTSTGTASGMITGHLCEDCSPLYSTPVTLTGIYDSSTVTPTFTIASDPIDVELSGRPANITFAFQGEIQQDGLVLGGTYTETISGLTPLPFVSRGEFQVSRVSTPRIGPTPESVPFRNVYLPLVLKSQ